MRLSRWLVWYALYQSIPCMVVLAGDDDTTQFSNNVDNDSHSSFARGMAAQLAQITFPSNPTLSRKRFPETSPDVCLAFLSCCDRIDLLNHTMAAAIKHMEEDEWLNYEIAWVDNGSIDTSRILESYQIEHALILPQNAGLAFGMNLLIMNLCQAPYILLMEEDWLYLDGLVATQTLERKTAISRAVAMLKQSKLTSFDGRQVMGVFLRPESYPTFLKPPFVHSWEKTIVDLSVYSKPSNDDDKDLCQPAECSAPLETTVVDYQIFCADADFESDYVWGSYTNGAGLYSRTALHDIGRMYGEPGDVFHDRYVEANYAYRASQKYCHAALKLGDCWDVQQRKCTAAFDHIGGGRGTRPRTAEGSKCADQSWVLYGTLQYEVYLRLMREPVCSKAEIQELRDSRTKQMDAAEYRQKVKEENERISLLEREHRDQMRRLAPFVRSTDNSILRQQITFLAAATDQEIEEFADKLEAFANSPHPIQGFWDSHGRPLV